MLLPDDVLIATIAAVEKHGSTRQAAIALGIERSTVRARILRAQKLGLVDAKSSSLASDDEKEAARKGELGFKPVLPGFEITRTSTQINGETDEVEREWITTKPEITDRQFALPDGHVIKGVSALVDGNGGVLAKWIKTREDNSVVDLTSAIHAAFDEYKGRAELIPPPAETDADLLTVYNIGDHHLGMFAWAQETGIDWDLKKGERILIKTMTTMVSRTPNSHTAIILNLGDFIHADNQRNQTEKSGNVLDVDTRYAKVLQTGVRLLITCVELALQKHEKVILKSLKGNHDPHTALALSIALWAFFHSNPRVEVDMCPAHFFHYIFGKVFICATHGDKARPDDIAGIMATRWPVDWGHTLYRYAYFGHIHHKSKGGGEKHGVEWETFQTLAAKDEYHASKGYSSNRSMTAVTHHRERGEASRTKENVG